MVGQQPGIFAGPLLVAIKLVTAVRLAAELSKKFERPVVPVFWNHSEDHDLQEANTFSLLEGADLIRSRIPFAGEGRPLDRIEWDEAALESARFLAQQLRITQAWLPEQGQTIGRSFSLQLLKLLPRFAVVHAEPYLFRPLLADFHRDAVVHSLVLHQVIQQQTEVLR
jgi:hypothetical protein